MFISNFRTQYRLITLSIAHVKTVHSAKTGPFILLYFSDWYVGEERKVYILKGIF